MRSEWINVNVEKPPLDKVFKARFIVDIPCHNIHDGEIRPTKFIFSEEARGTVLKLDITNDRDGFGTLQDISYWLKITYESIESRFDILDL